MNTIANNRLIAEFMKFEWTFIKNSKGISYDYALPSNFELIKEVETTIESVNCEVLEEQDYCMTADLKFHSDWNWLMEVVEKIESLGFILKTYGRGSTFLIKGEYYNTPIWNDEFFGNTKKESIYNACVEFIKWYNDNKS